MLNQAIQDRIAAVRKEEDGLRASIRVARKRLTEAHYEDFLCLSSFLCIRDFDFAAQAIATAADSLPATTMGSSTTGPE